MPDDAFDRDLRLAARDFASVEPPAALEQWLSDLPARQPRSGGSLRALVRILAAATAVMLVFALGFTVYWTHSGSAASQSGEPLTIVTEPPSFHYTGCQLARLEPVRMERAASEIVFGSVQTGDPVAVTWPYGTTGWLINGKAELLAPDGTLISTEGQTLDDLGGGLGLDNRFHVCQIGTHVYLH